MRGLIYRYLPLTCASQMMSREVSMIWRKRAFAEFELLAVIGAQQGAANLVGDDLEAAPRMLRDAGVAVRGAVEAADDAAIVQNRDDRDALEALGALRLSHIGCHFRSNWRRPGWPARTTWTDGCSGGISRISAKKAGVQPRWQASRKPPSGRSV